MKNIFTASFLFILFLLVSGRLWAQIQDTSASAKKEVTETKKSYFKAGINYLSNNVYNGRADSMIVPYIIPSIGYFSSSGFYINTSAGYLKNAVANRFDFFSLEAGYDKTLFKNFDISVYAARDFYNKESVNVQSGIKGSASVTLSYTVGPISLQAGPNMVFTTGNPDMFFNGGFSAPIYIEGEGGNWSILPGVNCIIGSQNYHEQYVSGKTKKSGRTPSSSIITTVESLNPSTLKLQVVEFSSPLQYETSKWSFTITPTFALPYSPTTYKTTTKVSGATGPGVVSYETEQISNKFYVEVGVFYKF
ncbi:MAG: hypothetical protein IKD55_07760 [Sediminibacterium sp.]|nr:hypothetical protein [Sediminibacterium sp.]